MRARRSKIRTLIGLAGALAAGTATVSSVVDGGPWAWAVAALFVLSELIGRSAAKSNGVFELLDRIGLK